MQILSLEPSTSRYQQTPAHLAAYAGHPHCLQWLLRTGSDVHQKVGLSANIYSRFDYLAISHLLSLDNMVLPDTCVPS